MPTQSEDQLQGHSNKVEVNKKVLYPVKIRIHYNYSDKRYSTGIDLTKEDFERSYLTERPRGEYKDLKIRINSLLVRAESIAKELKEFSYEKFEKQFLNPTGSSENIFHHYDEVIKRLKQEGRVNTASSYECSSKSLKDFRKAKGAKPEYLSFSAVNGRFLKDYEAWMAKEGRSLTTVGIYLRPLRAIFSTAIRSGEITKDQYPFGREKEGKYEIPQGQNVKKALTKEDLKKLYDYPLQEDSPMQKARDFWFFSYVTNGINIRDLAELRYSNIIGETVSFIRSKTKNTTKSRQKPIKAPLTSFAKIIIEKYGNAWGEPDNYIFPIIKQGMDEAEKIRRVQLFTRFINQHMKKLAKLVGVDEDISTYYARHTFTTVSVQNGASLEFIQDALGHSSINTTMNYWAGFNDNVKRENANKLMDF